MFRLVRIINDRLVFGQRNTQAAEQFWIVNRLHLKNKETRKRKASSQAVDELGLTAAFDPDKKHGFNKSLLQDI